MTKGSQDSLPSLGGNGPCDTCQLAKECEEKKIACQDFLKYINKQKYKCKNKQVRSPNRYRYNLIFGGNKHEST